jgi:Ca2+-binding RTX toxin-like protein
VRSGAPQEEQGLLEATKKEQTRSPEATASEEARCEGTRTIKWYDESIVTNDLPGCPNGGLLSGTDGRDMLDGRDGDDEIRGLGDKDELLGGLGSDVIYGGPGDDFLGGDQDNDVLYGGPGSDEIVDAISGGDDVLYGGDGDDLYVMGGKGEDVIYGGNGNDFLDGAAADRQQRDKLYCGEGRDQYVADEIDYADSSCEIKTRLVGRS